MRITHLSQTQHKILILWDLWLHVVIRNTLSIVRKAGDKAGDEASPLFLLTFPSSLVSDDSLTGSIH